MSSLNVCPDLPSTEEERNWASLAHLSAFAMLLFPLGHILAPYLIWRFRGPRSVFVEDQAREALNAQISFTVYGLAAGMLIILLVGFALLPILWLAMIVMAIVGSIKAASGVAYRYPFIMRFVGPSSQAPSNPL